MEISSKRGIWYVTQPDMPVKRFDSEAKALAYINGEPDLNDIDDEDYWDDDEE